MAGPSINGILTGWTANTITPVASTVAQVRRQSPTPPPGMPDPATLSAVDLEAWGRYEDAAAKRLAERNARLNTAKALETEAQASNDPAKLRDAWEAFKRAAFDVREGGAQAGQKENAVDEEQHRLAVEFKERNPTFEFGTQPGPLGLKEKLIFEAPAGQVRSFVSQRLSQETGYGTGTQQDSDVIGQGLGMRRRPGTATSPASAPASSSVAPATATGGDASQYDLTEDELAGGPIPNLRAPTEPQTPLEQLLRTIYPDAPAASAANPMDPRGGAASNSFSNALAYLTQQQQAPGQQSGYVPSPMMAAPSGNGAQIASTIPGAPSFLGGAINQLGSYGYAPPQVVAPAPNVGNTLSGLAAISAEQRLQKAQLDAQNKARDDEYFRKQAADQAAAAKQANIDRLRGGWSSPTF